MGDSVTGRCSPLSNRCFRGNRHRCYTTTEWKPKSRKGYERSDVWSKLQFTAGVLEGTNVCTPPIGGGQSTYRDSFLQGYSDDDNDCGPSINYVKEVLYL